LFELDTEVLTASPEIGHLKSTVELGLQPLNPAWIIPSNK
jgi:hypothetical protein